MMGKLQTMREVLAYELNCWLQLTDEDEQYQAKNSNLPRLERQSRFLVRRGKEYIWRER